MVESALTTYGYEPDETVQRRSSPSTARPTTTASSTPTRPTCARHAPSHIITGLPGRLRSRPDHRRLPPRRAVRRRRADRGQASSTSSMLDMEPLGRERHPRPRGAGRADPRARRAQGDGRVLRVRHLRPGDQRPRGRAVAVLRLPGRREGAERRRDVARPHVDVPRRLPAARPRRRPAHRGAGAGAHRRLRHQAADRALPAHPGVRRAVLRRPDLGDRVDRRHGRGRAHARHEELVPLPADALQPGPGAGAEHDRLLEREAPAGFKEFCAKVSIDTSAIQYESDDAHHVGRAATTPPSPAACPRCGSASRCSSSARGSTSPRPCSTRSTAAATRSSGKQVAPVTAPVEGDVLSTTTTSWPSSTRRWTGSPQTYVDALNCIHCMHDKYAYERIEMALHDNDVLRTLACGIAGLSVATDSLSAIKYATVTPGARRVAASSSTTSIEGDYPDLRQRRRPRSTRSPSTWSGRSWRRSARSPTYRGAVHTQSVLTITSNVVYGKATGNTPDGRRAGEPFAPGANPMNGRDTHGMLASALSVAKLPVRRGAGRHLADQHGRPARASAARARSRSTNLVGLLDALRRSPTATT